VVLICTSDEWLAKLLRRSVRGRVYVATTLDRCVELMAEERPSALLLDVRAGKNSELAVDRMAWLQRASPLTAIVVVTRNPTPAEVEDLARRGAYSYVDAVALDVPAQIRSAVEGAKAAAAQVARAPRRGLLQ